MNDGLKFAVRHSWLILPLDPAVEHHVRAESPRLEFRKRYRVPQASDSQIADGFSPPAYYLRRYNNDKAVNEAFDKKGSHEARAPFNKHGLYASPPDLLKQRSKVNPRFVCRKWHGQDLRTELFDFARSLAVGHFRRRYERLMPSAPHQHPRFGGQSQTTVHDYAQRVAAFDEPYGQSRVIGK
jgi:hypothetical protein